MKYWTTTPTGFLLDAHGHEWLPDLQRQTLSRATPSGYSHFIGFSARNPHSILIGALRITNTPREHPLIVPLSRRNQARFMEAMHYYGWCSYHDYLASQL